MKVAARLVSTSLELIQPDRGSSQGFRKTLTKTCMAYSHTPQPSCKVKAAARGFMPHIACQPGVTSCGVAGMRKTQKVRTMSLSKVNGMLETKFPCSNPKNEISHQHHLILYFFMLALIFLPLLLNST